MTTRSGELEPSPARVRQAVPFFGVTAMARSLAFYVDGLGFAITQQWVDGGELRWCWLELDGAALMLQTLAPDAPGRLAPATLGCGMSVCFMCDDALAVYDAARARGLHPTEPFVGNGLWVTSLRDPDGYRLDFESPTDVPEDTTLSEWHARGRAGAAP